MATNYSPKQFLRQVPNPLLKAFFDRRGELPDIDWDALGEMDADPVFEAWQTLPETARAQVERLFRSVAERQPYELNGLRNADFDFPTDPEDAIQEVRVKALRLSIVGPGFGRINFESDARKKRGDIYDLMDKSLNHVRMETEAINVTRAVFDEMQEAAIKLVLDQAERLADEWIRD